MKKSITTSYLLYLFTTVCLLVLAMSLTACSEEDTSCPPEICQFEVPEPTPAQACTANEGVVLVPEPGFTKNVITVTEVEGTDDHYYVIFDAADLELVSAGLETAGIEYDDIRSEIDGVLVLANDQGESCDNDTRTFLRMQISSAELGDFITSSSLFDQLMVELLEVFRNGVEDGITKIFIQLGFSPDTPLDAIKFIRYIVREFYKQLVRFLVWIVAMDSVHHENIPVHNDNIEVIKTQEQSTAYAC